MGQCAHRQQKRSQYHPKQHQRAILDCFARVIATVTYHRTLCVSGIHYFRYEAKEFNTLASYTCNVATWLTYQKNKDCYYDKKTVSAINNSIAGEVTLSSSFS